MRGIFEQAVRDEAVLQAALADADIFCWAASPASPRGAKTVTTG